MRTSAKYRHPPGWCPAKCGILQYLAGPTAATPKGCGYALQQNLDKATKKTKPKSCQRMFWTEVHALFFGFTDLRISSLKRVQT